MALKRQPTAEDQRLAQARSAAANLAELGPAFDAAIRAEIHGQTDTTTDAILTTFFRVLQPLLDRMAEHSICRPGCNFCCHQPVSVTEYEAELIGNAIGEKPQRFKKNQIGKHRSAAFKTPCHFLKDGACSIYAVRPMACRTHFSAEEDARWCDMSTGRHTVAYFGKAPLEARFINLLLSFQVARFGQPKTPHFQDIRQWFPKSGR
jgi:Fe-S-cluster containining protein